MSKVQKKVYHSPEYFTTKYEEFYNSDMYSDLEIILSKSQKKINCHKIVLLSSSEWFEKEIKNSKSNQITIKEENEDLFVKFLQFLYKGSIDYADIDELISFLTYSEKYGLKDLKEYQQMSQKDVLEGIIYYCREDFKNRFPEFEKIIEKNINFKKIPQEDLIKLYMKNEWLQHSAFFLNQIVKKEINDDTEYVYTPTYFLPKHCHSNVRLSKNNTVATHISNSYAWSKIFFKK
jgi:lipopolysaccharide biosynthesis regulator YciM